MNNGKKSEPFKAPPERQWRSQWTEEARRYRETPSKPRLISRSSTHSQTVLRVGSLKTPDWKQHLWLDALSCSLRCMTSCLSKDERLCFRVWLGILIISLTSDAETPFLSYNFHRWQNMMTQRPEAVPEDFAEKLTFLSFIINDSKTLNQTSTNNLDSFLHSGILQLVFGKAG